MHALAVFFTMASITAVAGPPEARLLRFPDIHEDKIVFSFAGDVYIVDADGGVAARLTSHHGRELFPKLSPDGQWVAFSGEYNGTRQVFVVPSAGGAPVQLTYYNDVGAMPPRGGFDYQVMDWTPDGKHVLFRGNRLPWGVRMGKYFTIPATGGMETALEVPEGGGGMFSPDGKKIVYTPIAREFRTWKRHRGGRAQDVWIYDLEKSESFPIAEHEMTDNQPVWVGDKIFFTSDREYCLNLFSYDLGTKRVEKATNHEEFDVLWPSAGPKRIVYQHAGYIRRYDPASGEDVKVSIQIIGDFPETMPRLIDASQFISGADLSPSGARAVFEARGDLYSVPAENGEIRNLTASQGVRERAPVWSPDGSTVAYLSDRSGEYEIYLRDQGGDGEERQLTRDSDVWLFNPVWSPDSKKLAFADKGQRLRVVDVASGAVQLVDKGVYRNLGDFSWSGDSRWIAYSRGAENQNSVLWVYDVENDQRRQLTDEYVNNFSPRFSPDNQFLYFLSSRDFNLTFSGWEFDFLYTNPNRIYAAALHEGVANPFLFESDEEKADANGDDKKDNGKEEKGEKGKKGKKKNGEGEKEKPATLQPEGFSTRVFALPMPSGNYFNLTPVEGGLFFGEGSNNGPPQVRYFDVKGKKVDTVLEGVGNFIVAAKGKKMLYSQGPNYGIVDARPGQKPKRLDLGDMQMKLDPKAEWAQIYRDAHRIVRDWFYDPNMHGYDWDALTDKYAALVPHATSRADLDFILGELGGELNAGHFYVNSGDYPSVARHDNGLLGADMIADPSGYYRVGKILPGENWLPSFRSPLRDVGVKVAEGDFILAVDGREIKTDRNFYAALEGKGNQVVALTVNDKPGLDGSRIERVRTITSETNLFYLEWVNSRRAYVNELSEGRIGYIHTPNTAVGGNRELFKHFYPQIDKDALIIDARYNGGGFIPFQMIDLLERPVLSYWTQRGIKPFRTPQYAHTGPKACLINGYSSSGGDALPFYFRERGMGKLFGTRTWGGLIGLQGNPGFADGGSLSVPMFRFYTPEGEWAVENEGVAPDVEVVDMPHLVAAGKDPTLEAAVKHLLEELEKNPPSVPEPPTPPDESNAPARN